MSFKHAFINTNTNALRPSAVIIVYQKFRQVAPTSLFITYTLHPLPDRDRYRIANAVSGLNSTTRVCHHTSHRQGLTSQRHLARLEHWAGFEPATFEIWATLPPVRYFYYNVLYIIQCCVSMVSCDRIKLPSPPCKDGVLPLDQRDIMFFFLISEVNGYTKNLIRHALLVVKNYVPVDRFRHSYMV